MKVTFEPLQLELPEPETIVTAGDKGALTFIVSVFEVTVGVETHGAFEVIKHVTVFPFTSVEVV